MNSDSTVTQNDVKVFTQPCQYFGGRHEATIESFIGYPKNISWYDKYLELGYRRVGNIYYRSICDTCDKCMPRKLLLNDFLLTNSQREILDNNDDIVLAIKKSYEVENKHIDLYKTYAKKHGYSNNNLIDSVYSIHLGYISSMAMEYYLGDSLIALNVIDETENAISSVYSYYKDIEERNLGVYVLLKAIEFARSSQKKYCYLGYCIEGLNKINYKSSFMTN